MGLKVFGGDVALSTLSKLHSKYTKNNWNKQAF